MDYRNVLAWVQGDNPGGHLRYLQSTGALALVLPEVANLYGIPQRPEHHPEVDVGRHMELALSMAQHLGLSVAAKIAVLFHDLGKAVTPADVLPRHIDHERNGLPLVDQVVERLKIHGYIGQLARFVCGEHLNLHKLFALRSSTTLDLIQQIEAKASPDHPMLTWAKDFVQACEADARGRLGKENNAYHQGACFYEIAEAVSQLPNTLNVEPETKIWHMCHNARLQVVQDIKERYRQTYDVY